MAELIIACLSQKGGVGKSTIARLIARTYAVAGWSVRICDFNTTQLTSVKWARLRQDQEIEPPISAEPCTQPSSLKRLPVDLVVADGRPDSDQSSLDIARVSDLIVLPTGLSFDDLEPQLLFANELAAKGVDPTKILFVLNKTNDSLTAVNEARTFLAAYKVAEQDLTARISYQRAQNHGRALSEVPEHLGDLGNKADLLAAEIVTRIAELGETA